MRVLILGASYGSVFGTKCLMAGHDVTLVCRAPTAKLINEALMAIESTSESIVDVSLADTVTVPAD